MQSPLCGDLSRNGICGLCMLYQIVNEIVFSSSFLVCSFEDIKTRSILKEISTLFADYPEYPTLQL